MATSTKRKSNNSTSSKPTTSSSKRAASGKSSGASDTTKSAAPIKSSSKQNSYGRWRYFFIIVLIVASFLSMLAICSFFSNWREDQSINNVAQLADVDGQLATNSIGGLGAMLGSFLVERLFGVMAVCVPFIIASFLMIAFRVRTYLLRKTILSLTSIMLIGSVLMAYLFPNEVGTFGSSLGGEWGYRLSLWSIRFVGDLGTGVVLFALIAIWLVYTSLTVTKYLGGFITRIFSSVIAFVNSIFVMLERLMSPKPVRKAETASLLEEEPEEVEPVTYYNIDGDEIENGKNVALIATDPNDNIEPIDDNIQFDPTEVENSDPVIPIAVDNDSESDVQNETESNYWENHNPLNIVTNEENKVAIEPSEVAIAGPLREDDYSQAIDRKNVVLFNYGVEGEQNAEPDPFRMEIRDVETSEPVQTNDVEQTNEAVVDPVSVEEPVAQNSDTEDAIDDIVLNEIEIDDREPEVAATPADSSIPKEESDVVSLGGLEIVGGYTNSKDIKEGEFEVAITSDADLHINEGKLPDNMVITTNKSEVAEDISTSIFDPTLELSSYELPSLDLLDNHTNRVVVTEEELLENNNKIIETLKNFNISIDKIKATIGPTVTLYEIKPAAGVRISRIKNLEDDIALSLSALGIRIIAPIPGKGTIGIEVPNRNKVTVSMRSVLESKKFQESNYELPIVLGRTIQDEDFVIDLAKMPHILVAGATGQGKSVGLNAIITSLLYKKHPSELKLVMVDPKRVELTLYQSIENHFLAKMEDENEAIITDTQRVVYTLNSLCIEMENRYKLLNKARSRNIKEYNEKFKHRALNPNNGHRYLPYFVVIIDEFADLIMTAGREIETPIARIAQLARAVGIHLVIATQRPTTNIITGVIKANFPARIAFRVSSMVDSRTILDQPGANQLIGRGDMLVSTGSEVTRVQCAFIDTPEVERITDFIGEQRSLGSPYILPEYEPEGESKGATFSSSNTKLDDKFQEVARYVVQNQQGSASTIQRNFSIGFNRAGRLMDQLERVGIVGKQEGSKPRQVLVSDIGSLELILHDIENGNEY